MSYDIYFVRVPLSASKSQLAQAALSAAEADPPVTEPDPEAERRKERLVAALRAVNSALEPFQFDYAELARLEGITEAEARRRFRHVELNGPEDGNGVQIELFDDWASISMPYWGHDDDESRAMMTEISAYARVLATEGGMRVYDPQMDEELDPYTDPLRALGVDSERATDPGAPGRPWWKFW